jgi:hypothetical protein
MFWLTTMQSWRCGIFQVGRLIVPEKAHEHTPPLQRRLRFAPTILKGIGRAERDQLDVLFGGGNVLRRIDRDVSIFPAVLCIEYVSAKAKPGCRKTETSRRANTALQRNV